MNISLYLISSLLTNTGLLPNSVLAKMEYCKNAFGYVCKALINYCINSCDIELDDDSPSRPELLNDCYCNCTNQVNYYRYCYNGNVNYQIFIILSVLLLCFGICIICGLCRYRIALYINNKKRALMSIPAYNSQAPPSYQNTSHQNTSHQDTSDNLLEAPPIYSENQIEPTHNFTATSNSYA